MVLSVELLPVFGYIHDIAVIDVDNYFLVCEILCTKFFHRHYYAYEVSHDSTPSYVFVKQSDLADHSVLGLYKSKFVILKYYVNSCIVE